MTRHLPARKLRERPDLDQLRRQAKELLAAFVAGDAVATAEVNAHYRDPDPATFALHDAQFVLARSYGFDSWPKLKAFVDGVTARRLGDAVRNGDVRQVRAMLKVRPELVHMDMAENNEHQALHYAVLHRLPEMVRVLMEYGADARKGIYPQRDATTALALAKDRGYDDIVDIISEQEQQRRAEHSRGTSAEPEQIIEALIEAIRKGDEERASAMLEADSDLTQASNRDGWTPLHMAAAVQSERLVAWLIQHGAAVNQPGLDDRTPLDMAAIWGPRHPGGAETFRAVATLLRRGGGELTPRSAVALGEADWLRGRHAEGLLVNPIESGLLTIAVKHDRPDILALLLDLGFDPDERTRVDGLEEAVFSWGMPLQRCADDGKYAMAEMLLRHGADPNGLVYASGSPMSNAYGRRDRTMIELLERHGGVVGPATAGYFRDTELGRRLVADEMNRRSREGAARPDDTFASALLDGGASGGDPEIVRMALGLIDWPREDRRWHWMLWSAQCLWNHIPWLALANPKLDRGTYITCFRLILQRSGANVTGNFGQTILHNVAASRDYVTPAERLDFATALVDGGARLGVRDELLRSTPLGWACRWGWVELVKLFLERGAGPVEAEAEPWATPMAWAEKMGHDEVVRLLRDYGR
jgi:ankyrin repeat protein